MPAPRLRAAVPATASRSTSARPTASTIKCLALPEHEFYAKEMVRIAAECIPVYSRWFGPYPYPQFTIAESYFAWNGNECGAW